MITRIQKWGQQPGAANPKAMLVELNIGENTPIEIRQEGGKIMLTPIPEPKFTLEEMLTQIHPDNLTMKSIPGQAVGKRELVMGHL